MNEEIRTFLFKILEYKKTAIAKYPGLFECKEVEMQDQLADIVDKAEELIEEDIKETFKYELTSRSYADEWKEIIDKKDKIQLVTKIYYYSDSTKKQYLEYYWNNMDKFFELLKLAYDELHDEEGDANDEQ